MSNNSCIFWFSGTGNSLYAAKKLSKALGDIPLVQITEEKPKEPIGGEGAIVGFVFPSYYLNLPRAVRVFTDKLEIRQGTYIFTIVTMGGVGHGSISALKSALRSKGLQLDYGKGIKMPDNYILLYNPSDPNKCEDVLNKNDKVLESYAAEITSKKHSVTKLPLVMNTLYKNIEKLDTKFIVKDNCSSCEICEKICPVKNIKMDNGKPVWIHHCEHCVACISWCPSAAIEYGDKTVSRNRYRNPRIKVNDLFREV